jgi:RNA polymerase sigma-70 factor (ECF subfamily)
MARSEATDELSGDCAELGSGLRNMPSRKVGALEALYRTQAKRLQRLFVRRVSQQDADDLVQETFTRYAHAAVDRSLAPECPESYLTQVAVNVMRDNWRSSARRSNLQTIPIEEAELPVSDPAAALEARDMLNRVEAVMMQLKPMTRAIFIARRFHGYSRAEIAAQTGLSVKAVDKHLGRAVDHLHRLLGSEPHG